MDFAILAFNQLVNRAAKWLHMFGGQTHVPLTDCFIINRGREQDTQHSQALYSWICHIPELCVVMPYLVQGVRDLLIAATLCDNPVIHVDDRWLCDNKEEIQSMGELYLKSEQSRCIKVGTSLTLVDAGYIIHLYAQVAHKLSNAGLECEVIDLRILKPINVDPVAHSVERTGRLLVVDGRWSNCGLAGKVIIKTMENVALSVWRTKQQHITLVEAPTPISKALEAIYYPPGQTSAKRFIKCHEIFQSRY
jgi:pyruvate dehydrogenase E1 component beta subunit